MMLFKKKIAIMLMPLFLTGAMALAMEEEHEKARSPHFCEVVNNEEVNYDEKLAGVYGKNVPLKGCL